MATVDTQAYDIPALDFYHLPFESDLPHDILELSCAEHHDTDIDYSSSILTPPPTAYPSDDETFSLEQIGSAAHSPLLRESVSPIACVSGVQLASSIWATPPASPPGSRHPSPASRFQFALRQPFYNEPESYSSGEDEVFNGSRGYGDSFELAAAPVRRRRKSSPGSSAGKAPRKTKALGSGTELVGAAVAALAQQRRALPSPEPASSYSSDVDDDDDDNDDGDSQSGDEEPENKRQTHNVLERKRRNDLKRSYQNLRIQLPNLSDQSRAPTGHILIKAAEYIEELKDEEVRVLSIIEHLRRENSRAHARFRAAQLAAGQ